MAKGKLKITASMNGGEGKAITLEQLENASSIMEMAAKVNKLQEKFTVQKVKLKDLFPEVEYSERTSDGVNDVGKKCSAPVHEDLKQAFSRLDSHLTILCNQYDENGSFNHKECFCSGFSINGDNTGVVLIGRRNFDDGGGINLVSPFARFEDHAEVSHILEQIKQEVLLYLFDGKHAPDAQLDLFDESFEED